jgi:hypothetical protein
MSPLFCLPNHILTHCNLLRLSNECTLKSQILYSKLLLMTWSNTPRVQVTGHEKFQLGRLNSNWQHCRKSLLFGGLGQAEASDGKQLRQGEKP